MLTIFPSSDKSVNILVDCEPKRKDNQSQGKPANDINQAVHAKVDSS